MSEGRPLVAVVAGEGIRDMLIGVGRYVQRHPGWIVNYHPDWNDRPELAGRWHGQGMIARLTSPDLVRRLRRRRIPVVSISDYLFDDPFVRVIPDNHAIGHVGARYLLDMGLRHLAYWGTHEVLFTQERWEGFAAEVEAAGLSPRRFDERSARLGDPAFCREIGRRLRAAPKPLGLLACYDGPARMLVRICHEAGLAVPHEVSVLGVDNDEATCNLVETPISSIDVDFARIGYRAAEVLEAMMAGQCPPQRVVRTPPLGVVQRASTDALAFEDPAVQEAVRFLREKCSEPVLVADAVRHVSVSRRLLEKRFVQATGTTPLKMLTRLRLDRACRLLYETDWPVALIARRSGFSSASHMSHCFARELHASPRAYREARRAGRHEAP